MGVVDLWPVLEDTKKECTLVDLQNKTLAIDMCIWMKQRPKYSDDKHTALSAYMRFLFARICCLLENYVKPIFVFDGPPSKLKQAELQRRQKTDTPITSADYSTDEKEMESKKLLDSVGLPHLIAEGEGEATCAALNQLNMADGCITEDGDAFLFGAKVVYRDFSCKNTKKDKIYSYKMEDIESKLSLTRDRLVAFALLSGCDFTKGVENVGKSKILEFFKTCEDPDILSRMKSWKTDDKWSNFAAHEDKPEHCRRCKHIGARKTHQASGCDICGTDVSCTKKVPVQPVQDVQIPVQDNLHIPVQENCDCYWHRMELDIKKNEHEWAVAKRTRGDLNFPDQEVIDTFLKNEIPGEKLTQLKEDIKTKVANMKNLEIFCKRWFPKNYQNKVEQMERALNPEDRGKDNKGKKGKERKRNPTARVSPHQPMIDMCFKTQKVTHDRKGNHRPKSSDDHENSTERKDPPRKEQGTKMKRKTTEEVLGKPSKRKKSKTTSAEESAKQPKILGHFQRSTKVNDAHQIAKRSADRSGESSADRSGESDRSSSAFPVVPRE